MIYRLRFCSIMEFDWGCRTIFLSDGSHVDACPHDTHHYHVISHRLGYGDDILSYCREHEFCHAFVEEKLHSRPSKVLWRLAHGERPSGADAAYEEMAAQQFQRWLRAHERPIISGVDWDGLKREALHHLGT